MQHIFCPTKDKVVLVKETTIYAGTLENPNATVPGRKVCSDNDYLCTNSLCPLHTKNT